MRKVIFVEIAAPLCLEHDDLRLSVDVASVQNRGRRCRWGWGSRDLGWYVDGRVGCKKISDSGAGSS